MILDNVGNRSLSDLRRVLKPGGMYFPNGGGTPEQGVAISRLVQMLVMMPFISQKIRFFVATPNRDDLQTLADLMETGEVTPVIDRCYPFAQAAEAIRYLESGHARGKVVVTLS